jgi:hypothetical protein
MARIKAYTYSIITIVAVGEICTIATLLFYG